MKGHHLMRSRFFFAVALACLLTSTVGAETFNWTSGNFLWNDVANWDTLSSFPNSPGATATIPAATGPLTIDLGQNITVGAITVNKAAGSHTTTIGVGNTNTLTIDGGTSTLLNGNNSAATGVTTIAAPIVFGPTMASLTFTVTQAGASTLNLNGNISGTGNFSVNRDSNGSGVVALGAANTYSATTTTLTGSAADLWLVVRLNDAAAIPTSSNILMANSSVLELVAGNFTRGLGTGADQIRFSGAGRNGWGAFGADREVNLGGALAPVTWGSGVGEADFGQLVLGVPTSTATVNFRNPLNIGSTGRNFRSYEGSAAVDGKISGVISGSGAITKLGDGVLSFAAANTYTGNTSVQGGMLRLDHQDALGTGNLQLGSGAVLAIGADTTPADPNSDFARNLGTAAGQIQLTNVGSGPNQSNSGFSAHGGNRSVVLNGGAMITWNSSSFLSGGTGTVNRNFILSADAADSTLEFKNPIDLNGAIRTVVARNGTAVIDAKLSGVLSGTGASGLLKDNPGTLDVSAANTYAGTTTIFAGVLLLTNANSIPGGITGGNTGNIAFTSTNVNNAGFIGLGQGNFTSGLGTGAGQVNMGTTSGFAAYSADRVVNLGGTSAQVVWGSGGFVTSFLQFSAVGADAAVDFQNPIDLNLAQRTIKVLNGTASVDAIASGVLSGAGGSLLKDGGGTLKLTAANTYDGGTSIILGRLLVSNTTGSGTGSGPVTVTAGTLGGTGSISGAVTVASGAHIAPGESIESLAVGSLTVNSGSFLDFELGAPGSPGVTSDLINVVDTNGLTLSGGSVVLMDGGGLAAGTYTLIDYAGTLNGDVLNLGTPTGPAGFTYSLSNNPGNTSIDLLVTAAGLPGDFNSDGKVDAGDYVTWRKNDGTNNALANDNGLGVPIGPAHFNLWRANFGNPPGSGAGGRLGGGEVPEPGTAALVCSMALLYAFRKQRHFRK
jgi:autotransporter-associated beta strand protein